MSIGMIERTRKAYRDNNWHMFWCEKCGVVDEREGRLASGWSIEDDEVKIGPMCWWCHTEVILVSELEKHLPELYYREIHKELIVRGLLECYLTKPVSKR